MKDEKKLDELADSDQTRFEFFKQFRFDKIDASRIGIEKLDFRPEFLSMGGAQCVSKG